MKLNTIMLRAGTLAASAVALVGCDTAKLAGASKDKTASVQWQQSRKTAATPGEVNP